MATKPITDIEAFPILISAIAGVWAVLRGSRWIQGLSREHVQRNNLVLGPLHCMDDLKDDRVPGSTGGTSNSQQQTLGFPSAVQLDSGWPYTGKHHGLRSQRMNQNTRIDLYSLAIGFGFFFLFGLGALVYFGLLRP